MSRISYNVCDRCKEKFEEKIDFSGYFKYGIKKENHIHFHTKTMISADEYANSDFRYDLCGKCAMELIDFLYMRENKNDKNS